MSSIKLPSYGANSVNIMKMSEALSDAGFDVTLLARKNSTEQLIPCNNLNELYKYYAVKPSFKINLSGIKNSKLYYIYIILFAAVHPPLLVYTRDFFTALFTSLLRIQTVYHCHGSIWGRTKRYIKRYISFLVRQKKLLKIAVVSEGLKEIFQKVYSVDAQRIVVVSNGIDLKRFKNVITKEEARSRTGLPENAKVICYSGHLYQGRGIDLLLELSKQLPEYLFVMVGGMPVDLIYWQNKAGENVIFKGHVPNGEVPDYLFSADVLVMPYQEEVKTYRGGRNAGSMIRPLKLFEYMASSRPIIASDLAGLREVLTDDSAYLVKSDDPAAWYDAIIKIMDHPSLAEQVGKQARLDVMQYTYSIIVDEMLKELNIK
jgi:glycosyltransferase involved in cell wall biosynthesis